MLAIAIHPLKRFGLFTPILLVLGLQTLGCQQSSPPPAAISGTKADDVEKTASHEQAAPAVDETDPVKLLEQMVNVYQKATSYEDAGELFLTIEGEGGQKDESRPIPFSLAFERPNKVRIHSLDASVVADGDKLRATTQSLEDEVLVLPCPETLSIANIFSDKLLSAAVRGQLDLMLPQLVLLVDADPLKELVGEEKPTLLEDAVFKDEKCHRVSVTGPQGTSVFWIAPKTYLLRKFEFPTNAFKEKFSVTKCSIWAEMQGARTDNKIAANAFKMEIPDGVKLLKRLLPPPPAPPSALLAQMPADFSFLDFNGGSVTRDSLKGKIVVLDLWATWCGWCFKGFPNLEEVYRQFKDNDKVVILAVNTDEATVSDAKVRKSFEDAQLTIPIVRDQQEAKDKVFQVPGLPTMVILGTDGTIEDYHIGYDANLSETLPAKLKRLLLGESLAKEELEKYEKARKDYDQQLSEALVDDGPAPAAVAQQTADGQ
jgi:thiol-disulfide isomerase/thioredoxin